MNAITLSSTTLALGVMIGITATHRHQVNTLVEQGQGPLKPVTPAEAPVYEAAPNQGPQQPITLATSDVARSQRPVIPLKIEKASTRDDALLEILAAIRSEQKSIRRQISESNRDLDELTFRVDTHSDSFKPLRTDVDRPRPMESTSQPMTGTGILPPKP